jgi:hypothetical protein
VAAPAGGGLRRRTVGAPAGGPAGARGGRGPHPRRSDRVSKRGRRAARARLREARRPRRGHGPAGGGVLSQRRVRQGARGDSRLETGSSRVAVRDHPRGPSHYACHLRMVDAGGRRHPVVCRRRPDAGDRAADRPGDRHVLGLGHAAHQRGVEGTGKPRVLPGVARGARRREDPVGRVLPRLPAVAHCVHRALAGRLAAASPRRARRSGALDVLAAQRAGVRAGRRFDSHPWNSCARWGISTSGPAPPRRPSTSRTRGFDTF